MDDNTISSESIQITEPILQKDKVLVAGWFSFELGHATAGDILSLQLACEWLEQAGYSYDVAYDPPFQWGIDWRAANPDRYSHVVFVCGPFEQGRYEADFLSRFNNCRLIGLNLTMLVGLQEWNPFDFLLERNSSSIVRPDIVFLAHEPHVPVVGVCLVEPYPGALDGLANEAIERLTRSRQMAVVPIDTRLDINSTNLRSAAEVESLIARVDVLITTRLHGSVLALKNNIPVLAIDPEAGGAKIKLQLEKVGWPVVFTADSLNDLELERALDYCLSEEARKKASECRKHAIAMADTIREEFIATLVNSSELERNYKRRLANPVSADWHKNLDHQDLSKKGNLRRSLKKAMKAVARWTLPLAVHQLLLSKSKA